MPLDIDRWRERLEACFSENGLIGPRLRDIVPYETAYGKYITNKMSGYITLANSFQSFFYDSLVIAIDQFQKKDATKNRPFYSLYLLGQLITFRSIRAGENLLYTGYPFDGLSLLRDVKDRAVFCAAQITGLTTWEALNAFKLMPKDTDLDQWQKWRRACEKEENRILKLMLREDSGFEESVKQDLRTWETFFNLELHNSRLTMASEFGPWMTGLGPLLIVPQPNNTTITSYMNCAVEVFWMIHKTLPFLQLREDAFGSDWGEKWRVLDVSFREMVSSLAVPQAKSVEVFITAKFPFTPLTIYVERNGIQ